MRRVRIKYDGGNGTFEYISDQPDLFVAISVATKEMFKQCIWLTPKETRITDVQVEDIREHDPEFHAHGSEV